MNSTNSIASQLDTLKTNSPVLEELGEESGFSLRSILEILSRRWLVFSLVSVAVCAFQVSNILKRPPLYQESFSLLVQPPEQDITNPLEGASGTSSNIGLQLADYYDTQTSILLGNKLLIPVLKKIYQKYPGFNEYTFSYDDFLKQLLIRRQNNGQILTVTYTDQDPERVQFVLQELADTYLSYTQNDQRRKTQEKLKFVDQQIPILQKQVVFLQTELLNLQQNYNFYNPEKQGDFYNNALNAIMGKQQEIKLQIDQTQNTVAILEKQLSITESQAIALDTLSQSPQYMQLVTRLNEINLQLAKESTRFTENNALVQQLRAERDNIIPLINQQSASLLNSAANKKVTGRPPIATAPNELRSNLVSKLLDAKLELRVLINQQKSLIGSEQEARKNLQSFNRVVSRYLNLQRELQLATDSLNRLLTASQTLEIEGAKRFAPWRLVSEIQTPRKPVNTTFKDLSVAVLLGLVVGGIAALIFENLDQTYHNPDDLAKGTGKTILGTVPWETKLNAVIKGRIPMENIRFLAAFSVLYSNLFFLRQKQSCRSFVITSATSSDGKSTISFFLALAAAKLGQRVLLIDGDRYYPQGEKWQSFAEVFNATPGFQYPRQHGIDKHEQEEIDEEEEEFYSLGTNLSYFKTEDNAMDPDQLMSSQSLLVLLKKWQEEFDIILIDTPPVLGLSDSKLIASKTDGVLLVARLDKTSKDNIRLALKELGMADLTLLGIVANGVRRASGGYNYYNRSRYYGQKDLGDVATNSDAVVP